MIKKKSQKNSPLDKKPSQKSKTKEKWETVIDFTKIKKGGIDVRELLKYL